MARDYNQEAVETLSSLVTEYNQAQLRIEEQEGELHNANQRINELSDELAEAHEIIDELRAEIETLRRINSITQVLEEQ